ADPIGRSLWTLGRDHQVLVVTHLPQIAAHADAHFRIVKHERDGRTVTEVQRLDREGRVVELGAMLGGPPGGGATPAGLDGISPATTASGLRPVGPGRDGSAAMAQARELLDAAEAWRGSPILAAEPAG